MYQIFFCFFFIPKIFILGVFVYHARDQRLETVRDLFLVFVYISGLVSPPMMWTPAAYPTSFLEFFFPLKTTPHQFLGYPQFDCNDFFTWKKGRKIHLGTPCWSGSTTLAVSATVFWQARSGFFRPQQKREDFDVLSGTGPKVLGSLGFKTWKSSELNF